MRNRQWRRAQRDRKITEVIGWVKDYWSTGDLAKHAKKRASHPQSCSNYCCGNPRKWFGQPTLQEKRAPRCDD